MTYRCFDDTAYIDNMTAALDYILNEQDHERVFGNEYSTALAIQVSSTGTGIYLIIWLIGV